ncbi:MAG: ABC transporter substrate-binding protein [Lachnospiraceae bacterium]|nr:ABC transporter substrate-binding protein [Lachnospiraceae bacterium]
MDIRKKCMKIICLLMIGLSGLTGCGSPSSDSTDNSQTAVVSAQDTEQKENTGDNEGAEKDSAKSEHAGLQYESSMELLYAENFQVDYYKDGYVMLTTKMDDRQFLIVLEDQEVPDDLDPDVVILQRPIKDIYLVASGVMDAFCELDGLSAISFSGQKQDGWYLEKARDAMADGSIKYAGKYSKPDYEMLVADGCSLAIENRMISHSPEVVEKLNDFGIPVMIEYSSYESHPLGRVEWVRFFGALLGKEDVADEIFQKQVKILESMPKDTVDQEERPTVAFFFITSNGLVQVRRTNDYVPKMIELAGGSYIFQDLTDEDTKRSTVNMQVEEFYNGAKDADYLIYNSSIDGGVKSLDELFAKCSLLKDFKAVQEGNVWCTTNDMYQQSLSVGYMMEDIYAMLNGGAEEDMHYLFRIR